MIEVKLTPTKRILDMQSVQLHVQYCVRNFAALNTLIVLRAWYLQQDQLPAFALEGDGTGRRTDSNSPHLSFHE